MTYDGMKARGDRRTGASGTWRWAGLAWRLAGIAGCIAATACAAGGKNDTSAFSGTGNGSTAGGASGAGSGSTDQAGLGGGGGSLGSGVGSSAAALDGGAAGEAGHTAACTDAGCSCIRIASIGHAGIWGACGMNGDGTGAFETWLNTQSSATVDDYPAKPTLTPAFLAPYNVIILQWLRDVPDAGGDGPLWQFSSDEVTALADWVKAGGGLISMSGYDGDGQEVVPLNTLLSFTDFTYNQDGTYGSTYGQGSCWGGSSALTAWNTATPIGAHLMEIGIQNGRSISVEADAGFTPVVDCPCPNNQNECAVHEDVGNGHVFAFTDEWVTYTSQWLGTASCIPSSCAGNTPADDFQVPQFWYNAISYAASSAQCTFTINNPTVIPR